MELFYATPQCRVVLDSYLAGQEILRLYGTQKFINVFIKSRHSYPEPVQASYRFNPVSPTLLPKTAE
jgi:hypothetical protein